MKKYLLFIISTLLIVTLCACAVSETKTNKSEGDKEDFKTPTITGQSLTYNSLDPISDGTAKINTKVIIVTTTDNNNNTITLTQTITETITEKVCYVALDYD